MRHKLKKPRLGGAVYVLPNLITTGNLFFGFLSIIKSLQLDFKWAASAILLAAVFDMLDGRVARMTGCTSEFGVQYDSLCDLVSFGLAPAFLMFQYGLSDFGRVGWILCFLFLACGALRLARFNVQSSIGQDGDDFVGLPIPMAAAVVACFVAVGVEADSAAGDLPKSLLAVYKLFQTDMVRLSFMAIACPSLAIAMVSNVAYRSHKVIKLENIKPFQLLVVSVIVLTVVAYQPEFFGFALFLIYALTGPFEWMIGWKKPVDESEIFASHDDESDVDARYEREKDDQT